MHDMLFVEKAILNRLVQVSSSGTGQKCPKYRTIGCFFVFALVNVCPLELIFQCQNFLKDNLGHSWSKVPKMVGSCLKRFTNGVTSLPIGNKKNNRRGARSAPRPENLICPRGEKHFWAQPQKNMIT